MKRSARIFFGMLAVLLLAAGSETLGAASQPEVVDLGNGILQETASGRMWQKERSRSFKSLEEAREYVKKLRLGGFDDWRLPTIYELYDLHYLFDLHKADHLPPIRMEGNYWLEDREGNGMAGSWEIGDQCEPERQYFKKNFGYVRAVRP